MWRCYFLLMLEAWTLAGGTVSVTVGESVERGFADAAAVLVDDGAGKSINLEVLIAEQPDLVIASADIAAQAEACLTLNELGIPAAQFHVETFSDYARLDGHSVRNYRGEQPLCSSM